jgi:hypothetical protein
VSLVVSLLMTVTLAAQQSVPAGSVLVVQRAVPFGTTAGKLLLLGGYLVFVDDQQPESSFVISRTEMENVTTDSDTITVKTREPFRDRTGSSDRVIFRANQPGDAALVTNWYSVAKSSQPGPATRASNASAEEESYQARHDHLRGACTGKLIVTATQLNFESIDQVDHSRRWEYRAIKEIALPNPYELEVKPFIGGSYKFHLDGSGMTPAAYRALVDRVTGARSGQ